MAPIITLEVKQPRMFRFIWIKYVRGFDPRVHCARCLVGKYSKHFRYPKETYYVPQQRIEGKVLDEEVSPFIYLCGVTARWAWNVHIAGVSEPGSRVTHEDERIIVEIENFRQFAIDAARSPPAAREFATCRNWQFGWCAFPDTPRERDLLEGASWNE